MVTHWKPGRHFLPSTAFIKSFRAITMIAACPWRSCCFESQGVLQDRVFAIRATMMYEPRYLRHLISGIRITGQDDSGWRVEANYAVFETPLNGLSRVFNVGRYLDRIVRDGDTLKF